MFHQDDGAITSRALELADRCQPALPVDVPGASRVGLRPAPAVETHRNRGMIPLTREALAEGAAAPFHHLIDPRTFLAEDLGRRSCSCLKATLQVISVEHRRT